MRQLAFVTKFCTQQSTDTGGKQILYFTTKKQKWNSNPYYWTIEVFDFVVALLLIICLSSANAYKKMS